MSISRTCPVAAEWRPTHRFTHTGGTKSLKLKLLSSFTHLSHKPLDPEKSFTNSLIFSILKLIISSLDRGLVISQLHPWSPGAVWVWVQCHHHVAGCDSRRKNVHFHETLNTVSTILTIILYLINTEIHTISWGVERGRSISDIKCTLHFTLS